MRDLHTCTCTNFFYLCYLLAIKRCWFKYDFYIFHFKWFYDYIPHHSITGCKFLFKTFYISTLFYFGVFNNLTSRSSIISRSISYNTTICELFELLGKNRYNFFIF